MGYISKEVERSIRGEEVNALTTAALEVLSLLYGAAIRTRLLLYRSRVLKAIRLPCRVVSVGNISVGGSGKTPVTILLAREAARRGLSPVILSRGYGREGKGVAVVSNNTSLLLDVKSAGDEPFLMAKKLTGVPVVVSGDRVAGAKKAIEDFSPGIILLDDGFQHLRLKRDYDIVLIGSGQEGGPGSLLPRGPLREPFSSLERADAIMVKGGADKVERVAGKDTYGFNYSVEALVDNKENRRLDKDFLRGKDVFALSAIAYPGSFIETLSELGAVIKGQSSYPDHHWFTTQDVEDISKRATGTELIVTTEKDAVRLMPLADRLPSLYSVSIEVDIRNDAELFEKAFGKN